MTSALYAYFGIVIFVGLYLLIFHRRDGWRKWVGPICLIPLAIGAYLIVLMSLGLPRPSWTLADKSYRVVSVYYNEPVSIYVWAVPTTGGEPVGISFPWQTSLAKSVRKLEVDGTFMEVDTNNVENPIHPAPVQELPPKTEQYDGE